MFHSFLAQLCQKGKTHALCPEYQLSLSPTLQDEPNFLTLLKFVSKVPWSDKELGTLVLLPFIWYIN